MKAEDTWRLWRRVLREPALAAAVMAGEITDRGAEFGLDEDQLAIAEAYAATPEGVRWAVEGYRYRLTRVTRHLVAEGAPLTATYLTRAGWDTAALALGFVEATGWQDRGPYIYGTTVDYLAHLERTLTGPEAGPEGAAPERHAPPALFDVIRLERTGAGLVVRRAAEAAAGPEAATARTAASRYRWTGRGAVVPVRHDIMGWLADQKGSDLAAVGEREQSVLVRLDATPAHYAFVAIGGGAARVAEAFADGADVPRIAAGLGIEPTDSALLGLLDTFVGWGLLEAPAMAGRR